MALVIRSDSSAAKNSINDDDLNVNDFKTSSQLKSEYLARVQADGGYVVDESYLTQICEFLVNNKLAGKVAVFCDARLGVKPLESLNSSDLVEKLYSLVDASGDLDYRLLEIPSGGDPANTIVSDITNIITESNATDANCPKIVKNDGKPYVIMAASAVTRSVSFYQKNPVQISASKSLTALMVHQPLQTYTADLYPLSFADSSNLPSGEGSKDFTWRAMLKPATLGTQSSMINRVSTVGTTPANGNYVQHVDRSMLESPLGVDKVALFHVNNPDRILGVGYKYDGSYKYTSSKQSAEFSEGLRSAKSLSIGGGVAKEFRRFPGNLYSLVLLRDVSLSKSNLLRDFMDANL